MTGLGGGGGFGWGEGGGAEFADAAVGAYDVGEGEGVPVAVGVGGLVAGGVGVVGAPVAAVVGGDVGAVGAYGDPGFVGGGVGDGGAVAVGWGLRRVERELVLPCWRIINVDVGPRGVLAIIWSSKVPAYRYLCSSPEPSAAIEKQPLVSSVGPLVGRVEADW
jgi:alkylated DNA nucleotide flippase Atl1